MNTQSLDETMLMTHAQIEKLKSAKFICVDIQNNYKAFIHSRQRQKIADTRSMFLKKDQKHDWRLWVVLITVWSINICANVIKGGKASIGIVEYCGVTYWILTAATMIFLCTASIVAGIVATHMTERRIRSEFPFVEGDIQYTWTVLYTWWLQTFIAGIVAGIVGIGGGMILGPLMLSRGVLPEVVTAVNATMVLFTSSSAAVSFIVFGQAPLDVALALATTCFVSSLVGKFVLDKVVKRYMLKSLLIFLLAGVIIVSMMSMFVSGVITFVENGISGFTSVC